MPTWGEILHELSATTAPDRPFPDFDGVRRRYLANLAGYTGRSVILYSTDWVNGATVNSTIMLGDMQGMMEVVKDLPDGPLDLIVHSPGGSAEATNSIVSYLRTKFDDIRVFVPLAAMSAATMLALAADRIVMGKHSQLGPIDPQISLNQAPPMPARTIVAQFERARTEIAGNPEFLGAWAPIIQQYGPGLLEYCRTSEDMARSLVQDWLARYMFKAEADAAGHAAHVAAYFSDYDVHKSHGIGIHRDAARAQGLTVDDLEADHELQDLVLSVHHAAMHTFAGPCTKIIENHLGKGYYNVAQTIQFQAQPGQQLNNDVQI